MSLFFCRRFIRTVADIGPQRLQRRLRYEFRQRLDRRLPPIIAAYIAGANSSAPQWLPVLHQLELLRSPPNAAVKPEKVNFSFLQLEQEMLWPVAWNNPNWPRLWQFHLHYFDWVRAWLDFALTKGYWPYKASMLESLIDQWIIANPFGRGDGWHSYTISLRTRNLIWLYRCCPQLVSPLRINSLWQQLKWLQVHPEHANGGNHWLENLTALALGGLQFDGREAEAMHNRAMRLLKKELADQVLADGGHEERSASYHLLMIDRLVELACALSVTHGELPSWLVSSIELMANWARSVRLEGGTAPRFNDSAVDASPALDEVLSFADCYLQGGSACSGLRRHLLGAVASEPKSLTLASAASVFAQAVVTDLPATGWTLLRPGHGWELAFKCGVPCPMHLPGHVHSDQLSVELSCRGQWLLSEAGTSIYGDGPERDYERSGAAHNVLQLGLATSSGGIEWIEPVEVWGSFRAARKAQPRDRQSGSSTHGSCYAAGSHDGFDRIGASHMRRVQLSNVRPHEITLIVEDTVTTGRSLHFRQWWHLAPMVPSEWIDGVGFEGPTATAINTSWHTTWFSEGFGHRTPRQSFCLSGCLPPGEHQLRVIFSVPSGSL